MGCHGGQVGPSVDPAVVLNPTADFIVVLAVIIRACEVDFLEAGPHACDRGRGLTRDVGYWRFGIQERIGTGLPESSERWKESGKKRRCQWICLTDKVNRECRGER
jgi:hypothetical protein